jgi:uncharacterized protein DUF4402
VRRALPAVVLAAAVLAAPTAVRAQAAASIASDAVVVTIGMSFTTLNNLDFGSVIRGVSTTIQPTDAAAGAWQVNGNPNAFVTITFTLPATLTNIQAVPGVTMPITFAANSARWRRATNNPAGATPFDPAVGVANGRFGPVPNPTLYVWIGGTVSPTAAQLPGIYQGTIVVSLAYN